MPLDVISTRSPAQVAQLMIEAAVSKHRTFLPMIFAKAFIAGVFLSFGGLLSTLFSGGSPGIAAENPGLLHLIAGFVFPVGLAMIVLQGQELLTSNMMVFPMAAIRRRIPIWSIPVNWIVVFFGNLCGSLFFAAILVKYSAILNTPAYIKYIQTAALNKAKVPEWHQIFLRGIGCNWLVCIAVWQAAGARETVSKVVALWFPIWTFVAVGFDHVVANMFTVPLGIMLGADITVAEYIRKSLIAAFIGNVVGAQLLGLPFLWFYWREISAANAPALIANESDVEDGNARQVGMGHRDMEKNDNGLMEVSGSGNSSANEVGRR